MGDFGDALPKAKANAGPLDRLRRPRNGIEGLGEASIPDLSRRLSGLLKGIWIDEGFETSERCLRQKAGSLLARRNGERQWTVRSARKRPWTC